MYLYLIGVVSSGLLCISEVLPFVNIPANGIVHTVLTFFKNGKSQVPDQTENQGLVININKKRTRIIIESD
jgi:hypothetical protein